jgi:murein DD-endopeptidase MepM/ murein hydrolase activator NlpD
MRALLGPHLGGRWTDKLALLRQWQPSFVLVLQPDVEKVTQLRAACPKAIIVGRFYHEDSHYASNIAARPKEFAREIHNEIASNPVTPLLDFVQSNNETNQDWQGIQRLNTFTLEWMALADKSAAYKCAILAFSVGNPDMPHKPGDPAGYDGRMLYWQQVLPSLNYAQRNNHLLLLHAYGYPNMFAPDADWYIYRYERQVQANLRGLGITNLKYAYGEIGIDRLIVDGKGGYKVVTNDQDYTNQLLQWERDQQGQNLLLGGAIFAFGDSGGWDSYDIASGNVASMLATHYTDHANEYQSPSVPGATNVQTVYLPHVPNESTPTVPALPPREWDERLTARGVTVLTPRDNPLTWRVKSARWYNEQEADGLGPDHHIMIDVVDEQGKRLVGVPLLVKWPSGEHRIVTEAKPGEPYSANYPMPASRNEFSVVVDGLALSEVVTGIGMGMETPSGFNAGIHTTTGVVFERVTQPQTQPAPEPSKPVEVQPVGKVPTLTHPIQDPAKRIVTQVFGVNPDRYAKFNLAGHNGVDFGIVAETPIVAVDDGVVVESHFDADGYGEYIKLRHSWGESLYAHLLHPIVRVGELVKAGEQIGASGNTGNSTGPHLHFGLRVNPYKRGWPFDGYSDPLPYLSGDIVDTPSDVLTAIKAAAQEFGLEWQLLASQAWAESSFNPEAESHAGAMGLMQIMPKTWDERAPKIGASAPFHAGDSARVAADYMVWLLKQTGGSEYDALAAYGWGIGNWLNDPNNIPEQWGDYASKIIHGRDLLKAVLP